jgi:two-component system sensor histidine kinase KdpD
MPERKERPRVPTEAAGVVPPAAAPAAPTEPRPATERRQTPRENHPDADFLSLVRRRRRGNLKVYIGSAAGVGKTYRMLQEAHDLRRRGIDIVVGFVETHGRADTAAQLGDLEVVPRKRVEYRGVVLEEMDVDGVIARNPEVAIVDELAHTNVPGLRHRKRWEDVIELLEHGTNVISAVNVQHFESLNDVIERTLGVQVRETVPDWVVAQADQVVNIDLPSEDLRQRLVEGKIYAREKVQTALANFFTPENLTTLRELALREVASSVDRRRQAIVRRESGETPKTVDRILVAMASDPPYTRVLLRKASRIAGQLNTDWYCVYVQTPDERADRIDSTIQRRLVENIQLAQAMGAEVVKLEGRDVAAAIAEFANAHGVTLVVVGQSRRSAWHRIRHGSVIERLIRERRGLDVLIVSLDEVER